MTILSRYIPLIAFTVVILFGFPTLDAFASKRIALVIGNSKYSNISELRNPGNDANLLAATLKNLNFEVMVANDLDILGMGRAIKQFGRKLRAAGDGGVGLFYYAGHGMQSRGENYLIPLRADIESENDLSFEAVSTNDVLDQMESAGTRLNLVILDACRNNPYKSGFRSTSRGFARVKAASGSLIAFSAAPGEVAADGTGENSPYTLALVKQLKQPGLLVEQMFKRVRVEVHQQTEKRQTPWEESSLLGDFYFTAPNRTQQNDQAKQKTSNRNPVNSTQSEAAEAWNAIRQTDNIQLLEQFKSKFSSSFFAVMAAARIQELTRNRSEKTKASQPTEVKPQKLTRLEPVSDLRNLKLNRNLKMNMQSMFPTRSLYLGTSAKQFTDGIKTASTGKINIKLFQPGSVVPNLELINATAAGILELGWSTPFYWRVKNSAMELFSGQVPFGMEGNQLVQWLESADTTKLRDRLYAQFGVKAIPCTIDGREGGGWYTKPIRSPSDFRGLKIRAFGIVAQILQKTGATVISVPGSEILPALESGVIDASEYSTPENDRTLGFQDIVKNYYFPGWHAPATVIDLMINLDQWNNLSSDERLVFEIACKKQIRSSLASIKKREEKALTGLLNSGVKIREFPAGVLYYLREASDEYMDEKADENPLYKEILQDYRSFMNQ